MNTSITIQILLFKYFINLNKINQNYLNIIYSKLITLQLYLSILYNDLAIFRVIKIIKKRIEI